MKEARFNLPCKKEISNKKTILYISKRMCYSNKKSLIILVVLIVLFGLFFCGCGETWSIGIVDTKMYTNSDGEDCFGILYDETDLNKERKDEYPYEVYFGADEMRYAPVASQGHNGLNEDEEGPMSWQEYPNLGETSASQQGTPVRVKKCFILEGDDPVYILFGNGSFENSDMIVKFKPNYDIWIKEKVILKY